MEILMNLEIVFGPLCVFAQELLPKIANETKEGQTRKAREIQKGEREREKERERERKREGGSRGGSYGKLAVNCCCCWHRLSKVVAFIIRFLLYMCVCVVLLVRLCVCECFS